MASADDAGRQQGLLAEWNDDRGFGFIEPAADGSRVFAHVSAFPRGRRPTVGCEVTYVEGRDERNRPRASQVQYVGARKFGGRRARGVAVALGIATLFFAALVGLTMLDELSIVVVAAYGLLSAATFVMYADDKSAAVRGRWRTSEASLHAVALVGGWPGALVARPVFRHKTTKQPFRTIFWLTVLANCGALAWFVLAEPFTLT